MNGITTTWDFSKLPTGADYDTKAIGKSRKAYAAFRTQWYPRTDYLHDPAILCEALDAFNDLHEIHSPHDTLSYVTDLSYTLNQASNELKAALQTCEDLENELADLIRFFVVHLSTVSPEAQEVFLASPLLTPYHHFLDTLFRTGKHTKSEETEQAIKRIAPWASERWNRMVSQFLAQESRAVRIKGEEKLLSFAALTSALSDADKPSRDAAAVVFNQILVDKLPIATEELNATLGFKKEMDVLRGYPRADSARHLADDIDTDVVDALVAAVADQYALSKQYYALKAQLMGVTQLAYHERNVPLGEVGSVSYTYEQAVEMVHTTLSSVDTEMATIFETFATTGSIDAFPYNGKRSGAFCAGNGRKSLPSYILMNFTGKFDDVLTLAHETGHGIHNELMRPKQNELNFGTPLSTAEVASTFVENLVFQRLLNELPDEESRRSLRLQTLNDEVSTIFRQIAFYQFETELHTAFRTEGYLSNERIGELFQQHMVNYMGDSVEQSAGSENWWVYVGHFRNPFYVYSYASGFLIAKALARRVAAEPTFISAVKEILAAGMSDSPKNLFKKYAGIDLTDANFWREGLQDFEDTLQKLEKK